MCRCGWWLCSYVAVWLGYVAETFRGVPPNENRWLQNKSNHVIFITYDDFTWYRLKHLQLRTQAVDEAIKPMRFAIKANPASLPSLASPASPDSQAQPSQLSEPSQHSKPSAFTV